MFRLRRRWPLLIHPARFLPLFLAGLAFLAWTLVAGVDVSLQTGHVFLLVTLPVLNDPFADVRGLLLLSGLFFLAAAYAFGAVGGRRVRAMQRLGAHAGLPRARFYPFTFLLGLFVTIYGLIFLFDASTYGDTVAGVQVAFVYFDYAGLGDRPVVTFVSTLFVASGLFLMSGLAFARGLSSTPAATPRPSLNASGPSVGPTS